MLRSLAVAPIASSVGHIAGGTTYGLLDGKNLSEAFNNSLNGLGTSVIMGTATSLATTYAVSKASGMNPWTGKYEAELKSVGAKGTSMKKLSDNYIKQKGMDAHAIKYEYLGDTKVSRFNLYKTQSGQIIISDGKNVHIPTQYFIE